MAKKDAPAAGTPSTDEEDDKKFGAFQDTGTGDGADSEDGEGMVVDLSGTGEGGFVPVPRGLYPVSVDNLEFGVSKRSGNKMWSWTFVVDEGHEFAGRKFFYHTVFTEGGLPRVKQTLARIKDDAGYAATLVDTPFNPATVAAEGRLLGARCRLRIDIRKYEGENRNDVKQVLVPEAAGGGGGFAV